MHILVVISARYGSPVSRPCCGLVEHDPFMETDFLLVKA